MPLTDFQQPQVGALERLLMPAARPATFDASFNTILSPAEEAEFLAWKAKHAPRDSGYDYDLRGAFKAKLTPGRDGHWSDEFKKPNHPTFSNQSLYAEYGNPGTWAGKWDPKTRFYAPPVGRPDVFTPGVRR